MNERVPSRLDLRRGFLLCIALFFAGFLFLFISSRQPVSHEGKTVAEWALALNSGDPAQRQKAELAFTTMGKAAVPQLSRIIRREEVPLRLWIWRHSPELPKMYRGRALRMAGPLTRDLRIGAARAVSLLGPLAKDAIPALCHAAETRERQVAFEAGQALSAMGTNALPALESLLRSPYAAAREVAAYTAGQIGTNAIALAPRLALQVQSTNTPAGAIALAALGKMGFQAVPVLARLAIEQSGFGEAGALEELMRIYRFNDRKTPVGVATDRSEALEELFRKKPGSAKLALLLLNDPAGSVRLVALRRIEDAGMDLKPALPSLVRSLSDSSPEVRTTAARLLASMGPLAKPALPRLRELTQDPSDAVRAAVDLAIAKIGD